MTPATYAKGGAGAHIDYTTVDSDYGRVLVAATQKGIAAVFLGDNDRTLEKNLKHDFPAADITRNDERSGAARKRRAGASVRPQAVGARCGRRAARYRRHRLPVEGLEGADQDPGRPDPHLWRDRPPHRRPGLGPRRRPRLRHQPGGRRHSLPSRRRLERRADRLSLGRGAQGAAAGRRTARAAARRRRRRRHGAACAGRTARTRWRLSARFSQPTNSPRMRPPSMRPPSRRRPLPVTISTTRRSRAVTSSRKVATARSAAASVMPCRSSEACGRSLPRDSEREMSRSKF